MRDAFGGAFMIRLFLIFIIIYVGFTAIALNDAKAFKVKDLVISYLEENEITDIEHMPAAATSAMLNYFEKEVVGGLKYNHPIARACEDDELCFNDIGIVIKQIDPDSRQKNKLGVYYKVTTYFGYDVAFFKLIMAANGSNNNGSVIGNWEISGETRTIVKG